MPGALRRCDVQVVYCRFPTFDHLHADREGESSMSESTTSGSKLGIESYIAYAAIVLGFNLLAPFMVAPRSAELTIIILGMAWAEVVLLATWGVFNSLSLGRSLAATFAAALVLFAVASVAILARTGERFLSDITVDLLVMLLTLPVVLLSIQTPLWVVRIFFRAEIARPDHPPTGSYRYPVRIKDLLLATAAIGVAVALVKAAASLDPQTNAETLYRIMLTVGVVAGTFSLIVVLPMICLVMNGESRVRLMSAPAIWLLLILVGVVTFLGVTAGPNARAISSFLMISGAFTAVLCGGLFTARSQGYRLRWSSHQVDAERSDDSAGRI